jgi:hypothetical protein
MYTAADRAAPLPMPERSVHVRPADAACAPNPGGYHGEQRAAAGEPARTHCRGVGAMICILHGYLLEGSGSNLWTRSMVEALCRQGVDVHLMAQENHPDRYPFITEARRYNGDEVEVFFRSERQPQYAGSCMLHKPDLGDLLPVYVRDEYEEFSQVVPMIDLGYDALETYLDRNVRALHAIVRDHGIHAIHANHTVLMPVVAQRVSEPTGIPYAVMPHGSALEFAVKPDERFRGWGEAALSGASRVFVHGDEMRERVRTALPGVDLQSRFVDLHLGVIHRSSSRRRAPSVLAASARWLQRWTITRVAAPRRRQNNSAARYTLAWPMLHCCAHSRQRGHPIPSCLTRDSKRDSRKWTGLATRSCSTSVG